MRDTKAAVGFNLDEALSGKRCSCFTAQSDEDRVGSRYGIATVIEIRVVQCQLMRLFQDTATCHRVIDFDEFINRQQTCVDM